MAGDRGALWWEFHRLITEGLPKWILAENVPGLLSSRGGRDFAIIVDSLADLGYTVGWRVLDSQFFGVPQRRRRVFIVAVRSTGNESVSKVLALAQGMSRDPKPSRKARQVSTTEPRNPTPISSSGKDIIGSITTAFSDKNYSNVQEVAAGSLVGFQIQAELIGRSEDAGPNGKGITDMDLDPAYTLNIAGGVQAVAFNANQDPDTHEEMSPTLNAGGHSANAIGIAFAQNQRDEIRDLNDLAGALAAEPGMKQQTYVAGFDELNNTLEDDNHHTLRAGTKQSTGVIAQAIVRRLTPLECERLQGFQDNWTDLENNSNSQRYKQMGNAVAVPVVTWIMKRIAAEEKGLL